MRRHAGGVLGLLALALVALSAPAAAERPPAAARVDDKPAYQQTKTLTRTFVDDTGAELLVDQRDVTVSVDHTLDLRGRERIQVRWAGARPSAGRAADPYGENGLNQEYPVVILQCRGLDDPTLPPAQQLAPETCWTSTRMQRSQSLVERTAAWRHDRYAPPEDKALKSGMTPFPDAATCTDVDFMATHLTPFVAANGTVYPACTAETMPPEAAVGAAFPPAEISAFTDADGNGTVQFEVRSNVENESLGCSDKVACSLVVIPIMGLSCDADPECQRTGQFEPGSSNFTNLGPDLSVSPMLWWSESNWRHRFSVPLTFGLPPDACNVLDKRPPTGFYGTELIGQAALQWAPAYCLDKERFKFQANAMPDDAAFSLMEAGEAAAAFVSSAHETTGLAEVAYAPTAVTGFAVGYVIDRPDNAGEFTELRMNARLLAKLLTQSYLGSDLGRGHKGIGENPLSINLDPEFQRLNPGLDTISREAAATILSLSESSDVMTSLTSYIASDPKAMEWVDGKPDPWGMVVNPSYRKIDLPTAEWPLLDEYVPTTQIECLQQNPAPYFTQIAAPVTSLRKIAEAVLDAWPNVQTRCERATISDPWKLGRVARQGMGSRFMLGVVGLGDAARFGLHTAALEAGDQYVAPSDESLAAAVRVAEPGKDLQPHVLDQLAIRKARGAYPGTLVVYTAAPVSGMDKKTARQVAQFVEVATSEGQRPGHGNGELPDGYLPLVRTGVTKALHAQALEAAEVIAAQEEPAPEPDPSPTPAPAPEPTGDPAPPIPVPSEAPTPPDVPVDSPTAEPTESAAPSDGPSEPAAAAPMPGTESVSSGVAGNLLPMLIILGFLGSLLSAATRLAVRGRGRP